ncbi:Mysoin-binding motif of peroxisomes-domain-containing protein [Syncephalastrum racemosum]|uniref:Vezatin n=1 Tax=Syncephalastrum racemosum TaxID=13706 RepID=A0A1X2HAT6_SYNRA|nr:Mysoin-binding motif of peroxisomes-domain-containing protein [Syncephalastrum racemosum]
MAEFVVYEDTPLADYLNSIDSAESTVKLAPPPGAKHRKKASTSSFKSWVPRWPSDSIYHYWRSSMLHDTFSTSLPLAEETAFEEKFKYLIVTSPLLNETLMVQPGGRNKKQQKHAAPHMTTDYSTPTSNKRFYGAVGVGTMGTLSALFAALGAETLLVQQQQKPASQTSNASSTPLVTSVIPLTVLLTSSVSVFFVYRHVRRSGIRQLYHTALSRLQSLMENSETLDSKVHRALITIQEIELVSRGYRLSMPLSPVSRIEQTSKARRCIALRSRLSSILRRAFIIYEEAIIDLVGHVDKNGVSRLYDMYNVRSVASLSAVEHDDETSLEFLRALAQLMHTKRRECMMQFLALNIVSEGHDSVRRDYESSWRAVTTVLANLETETISFVNQILDALDTELYKPAPDLGPASDASASPAADGRLRQFVHRLASLDQQIRTVEAKLYICNEDVRQLVTEDSHELRERLRKEYTSIEQDFSQLVVEWEAGRDALSTVLDPPELGPSPSSSTSTPTTPPHKDFPSPLASPNTIADDRKVYDAEDDHALMDLPLPARASVFEAVSDVIEKNANGRSKKSRAERIAEMKAKREEEVRTRANQMDPQHMVFELKNVLDRRATELHLDDDTDQPEQEDLKDDNSKATEQAI